MGEAVCSIKGAKEVLLGGDGILLGCGGGSGRGSWH